MLVGEVYPLRRGEASGPLMLSAGKPVAGSVIATIEAQVSRAHRRMVVRSTAGALVAARRPGRPGGNGLGAGEPDDRQGRSAEEHLAAGGRDVQGGGPGWGGHVQFSSLGDDLT